MSGVLKVKVGGVWTPVPATAGPHHATHEPGGTDAIQFTTGILERGRTVALGQWQDYTPAWIAATTAPSIGNGFLVGRYTLIGTTVQFIVTCQSGSTTGFGSGTWGFGLPPITRSSQLFGEVWLHNGITGVPYVGGLTTGGFLLGGAFTNSALVAVSGYGANADGRAAYINSTVPFDWATNRPSYVMMHGIYEMA